MISLNLHADINSIFASVDSSKKLIKISRQLWLMEKSGAHDRDKCCHGQNHELYVYSHALTYTLDEL